LLFTGDGKGKTTAALGMVMRAAGHGLKSLVVQFIKAAGETGELSACRHLPGVEIIQAGLGFVPEKTSPAFAAHQQAAYDGLKKAAAAIGDSSYDLVVLDEICPVIAKGLLTEEAVIAAVRAVEGETVVVMTGRRSTPGLVNLADTVTEMAMIKHGYSAGWTAQKGVEY
jgi:cob(I)alamin adenosyltransferase